MKKRWRRNRRWIHTKIEILRSVSDSTLTYFLYSNLDFLLTFWNSPTFHILLWLSFHVPTLTLHILTLTYFSYSGIALRFTFQPWPIFHIQPWPIFYAPQMFANTHTKRKRAGFKSTTKCWLASCSAPNSIWRSIGLRRRRSTWRFVVSRTSVNWRRRRGFAWTCARTATIWCCATSVRVWSVRACWSRSTEVFFPLSWRCSLRFQRFSALILCSENFYLFGKLAIRLGVTPNLASFEAKTKRSFNSKKIPSKTDNGEKMF